MTTDNDSVLINQIKTLKQELWIKLDELKGRGYDVKFQPSIDEVFSIYAIRTTREEETF
jgi:hypothetical protein